MSLYRVSEPSELDLGLLEGFSVHPRKLRSVDKGESEMENDLHWLKHSFSIVTYNILADKFIKDGYTHLSTSERYLKWRHPRIMKELQEYDADIICLQEVEDHHFQDKLEADLNKIGYTSKNDSRGLVIAFKRNKFELLDVRSCLLANIADTLIQDVDLKSEDKERLQSELHMYDQIVLLFRLRCLTTNRTICVGNLHVMWGLLCRPDIQLLQVSCAASELVKFAGDLHVPHLLVGDFNTPVNYPAYEFLQGRKITRVKVEHVPCYNEDSFCKLMEQHFQITTQLVSAYSSVMGHEPKTTNLDVPLPGSTDVFSECLDYLWLSSKTLRATAVLDIPPMDAINESVLLPNAKFPSDHLPLLAYIQFKG